MSSIIKVDTIQNQSGANIISESSNTITVGASGDTITIPSGATISNSGTATGFGVNTPAFEAYLGVDGGQTVLNNTITIVSLDTEVYDEGSCFNATGSTATLNGISVPARTFLPNVAGKYLMYGAVLVDSGSNSNINRVDVFFHNESGNIIAQQQHTFESNPVRQASVTLLAVVDLNGTSNSVQLRGRVETVSGSGQLFEAYPQWRKATYMGGFKLIT